MLNIIRQNKITLLLWLLLAVVPLFWLSLQGRRESFLLVHQWHNAFLDMLMPWFTQMGEGIFIAVVILFLLLFKNTRLAIGLTLMQLFTSLGVQLLKRQAFGNWDRPMKFLGPDFVRSFEDVHTHMHYSFPSGHTAAAFALFGSFLLLGKQPWNVLWILPGLLVAWSRIYLGQHFPMDTLAGMLIAMSFGIALWPYMLKKLPAHWNKPLLELLSRK